MNSDTAIIQGQSHYICQDYARSGAGYALLSDGCSGSADTDFGARLIVKLAEKKIQQGKATKSLPRQVISEAARIVKRLELKKEALDATMLTMLVKNNKLYIFCAGDGLLLLEYRDGTQKIIDIEYSKGYPFYINYLLNGARLEHFLSLNARPTIEIKEYREESPAGTDRRIKAGEKMEHLFHYQLFTVPMRKLKKVVLFSDGIKSFRRKKSTSTGTEEKKINYEDIIFELTNFKNTKGRFVQRRLNKFMKQCRNEEITNQDDLSIAALDMDE